MLVVHYPYAKLTSIISQKVMIQFELPQPTTFQSFFQVSFNDVAELKGLDLPLTEDAFVMLALRRDIMLEELNNITNNLEEKLTYRELYFEVSESLDHNILYIFN